MRASNRLDAPYGARIDRTHEIEFSFEGRRFRGFRGDTIASALAANNRWVLSRSFKYHRPRGILSMAGFEANTLVQVGYEPNVRADLRQIAPGMRVEAQNVMGSVDNDRKGVVDKMSRFLPVGFYYRSFMGPGNKAFKYVWEPFIRQMSGLGRVSPDTPLAHYDKVNLFYDVVVIGGGPAGMSAAISAASAGAEVLLVDEQPALGGSLSYARFGSDVQHGASLLSQLMSEIAQHPRIRYLNNAVVTGCFDDNFLTIVRDETMYRVRAKRQIFATGSVEQPAVFRYNDLPGIMLGSAAQRLIRWYGVRPGSTAVVLTNNSEGYGVALDLIEAGVRVATVVDLREDADVHAFSHAFIRAGVEILRGYRVWEATRDTKRSHVGAVYVTPHGTQSGRSISCDLVCMSPGYMPAWQLPCQIGAKVEFEDASRTARLSRIPSGSYLAGSLNGFFEVDSVIADGKRAGREAAIALGLAASVNGHALVPTPRLVPFDSRVLRHPRGKDFVDFDEDVQVADLENAIADGYRELELVKRFSTVSMGTSQGKHSALSTAAFVSEATGLAMSRLGITTSRPPATPETMGAAAGPHYDPYRLTPMHYRHLEANAKMVPVNPWWRPGYYGSVVDEVKMVREAAGMIDMSTLGGFEVRGPDAAAFLDRLYTLSHSRQEPGHIRYALMLNEMGTITDDGVIWRLANEHFYVTSTTGAVGRTYQTMLWWNAQWRMNVDVLNTTNAFARINVTGPRARDVLLPLSNDIDFSKPAFPFLAGRVGTVAGIAARVMRIGYTGELSYEMHVPASRGEALWDLLLERGASVGLRPFGLEASRILRLEKGHVIIGQDTDAMSTPDEAGLTWAVSRTKPFFVGKRALQLRNRNGSARQLVGFEIAASQTLRAAESCLVMRSGEPVGHVTSVCDSPTLGRQIGMALIKSGDDGLSSIEIRARSGDAIHATVAKTPFYDAANVRQEV